MAEVRFTRRDLADLAAIHAYRTEKSAQTAQRIEECLDKSIRSLALRPRQGVMTDIANVHRWPLVRYRYTVFFRLACDEDLVEVLRVVPSSRVRRLNVVPDE